MGDPEKSPEHLAAELLREDFAGLYQVHLAASEDYGSRRFRTLLTVQAVPLAAVGALVSAGSRDVDLLRLPLAVYVLLLATAALGHVVLVMWVRSALLVNTYARALNQIRGRYVALLRKIDPADSWEPWLPTTPKAPNWNTGSGARDLSLLVAVLGSINGAYFGLGATGSTLPRSLGTAAAAAAVLVFMLAAAVAYYAWVREEMRKEQKSADDRLKKRADDRLESSDSRATPGDDRAF